MGTHTTRTKIGVFDRTMSVPKNSRNWGLDPKGLPSRPELLQNWTRARPNLRRDPIGPPRLGGRSLGRVELDLGRQSLRGDEGGEYGRLARGFLIQGNTYCILSKTEEKTLPPLLQRGESSSSVLVWQLLANGG